MSVPPSFSPDGKRVVTGSLGQDSAHLGCRDGRNGDDAGGHVVGVDSAAFSPDGVRIATVGDSTARIWDVATGATVMTLEGKA